MNITKRNKIIIAAAALVGAAAVTGSAFTAGGLLDTSTDNFIGGTVDQLITNATITNVDYDIGVNDEIDEIIVTIAGDVETRILEIEFYDDTPAEIGDYTCTPIDVAGVSSCTTATTKVRSVDVEQVTFRVDN